MTPRRGPMSEKEKTYAFCLLFPIFWPMIPVLLICDGVQAVVNLTHDLYWKWRSRHDD